MGETELRGTVQIEIDGSGLEARLVYTPDEEGEIWDKEKILNLFSRSQITEGIKGDAVDSFLKTPPKPGEDGRITIPGAEGTAPVPPKDEEVEWKDLPIPEHLKEDAERVLSDAGEPEIIQTRVEKVQKKKKVEKKQKLGFLPAKEETVTITEKREVPQRIEVDPEVVETGWVEEGMKIATVYAGQPGKMGKDIYGTPVMPEREPAVAVYPGEGVEKQRSDVVATVTGFLRRGANWVEVIPFSTHHWEVKLSKDRATALFDFFPGDPRAALPQGREIIEAAGEKGVAPDTWVGPDEIDRVLKDAVEKGQELTDYSISTDLDGGVEVHVAEDCMKATLTIQKGRGKGKHLDLKEVGKALRESGVKGFKPDTVKKDILEFYRSSDQVLDSYLLVEGTPPEEPVTPEFVLQVKYLSDKDRDALKKRLAALSSAEMGITSEQEFPLENVEAMGYVVRHQPIGHFEKEQKGKNGRDVYGKEVPAQEPPKPVVKTYENVSVEDGEYSAEVSGVLEKGTVDGAFMLRIRPYRDGEVEINTTEDMMKAFLTIIPPEGAGERTGREQVWSKIKERGITRGLNEEAVERAVDTAEKGETVENLCIAEGQEPRHASRNQINFFVTFADSSKVTIKENGTADYKNLDNLTAVSKGQPIAHILPPEETGEDGWDITGKTLTARSFQGFDLEIGENIAKKEEEDGGITLIAESDGKLLYDKKSISVQNIHVVDGSVGVKTGNVKFQGAVRIKGSVESGFSVIAGDSIQIGEGVEGALLSSEGDVLINQGVKGGGKAVIRTKENIKAGFIEMSTLLSVKDIMIKNFCLRSVVKCNGKFQLMSEKGHLVGGTVRSKLGIDVMNLGSDKGAKTRVCFGQDYLIADQIEIEEKEIQKIKEKLLTFDVYMHKMEKQGDKQRLEKARKEKHKLMKILEKRGLRLFTLREKFEEHFPSEVQVRGTMYPGVVVESHGRYYEPKEEKKNITIVFNLESGQLEEKSNREK